MRKYEFATTLFVVGVVTLFFAAAMLWKAQEIEPIQGVDPTRYTKKQLGPSLDDTIRSFGYNPADCYETSNP
jgi:hypothetical protein